MCNIAVIVDDLFEDSEYIEPTKAFVKEGFKIFNLGLEKGKFVTGKHNKASVLIDENVGDVSIDSFDALLIPGGYSPDKLRAYKDPLKFVSDFVNSGKPVFVICHGPQLLISAKVIKGKTITGWKSIAQDIINAGATYEDKEVIIDRNIVSSRSPEDLPAFIKESIAMIKNKYP